MHVNVILLSSTISVSNVFGLFSLLNAEVFTPFELMTDVNNPIPVLLIRDFPYM